MVTWSGRLVQAKELDGNITLLCREVIFIRGGGEVIFIRLRICPRPAKHVANTLQIAANIIPKNQEIKPDFVETNPRLRKCWWKGLCLWRRCAPIIFWIAANSPFHGRFHTRANWEFNYLVKGGQTITTLSSLSCQCTLKNRCIAVREFGKSLKLREVFLWKSVHSNGHCSNSFWPTTLSNMHRGALFRTPFFHLFFDIAKMS